MVNEKCDFVASRLVTCIKEQRNLNEPDFKGKACKTREQVFVAYQSRINCNGKERALVHVSFTESLLITFVSQRLPNARAVTRVDFFDDRPARRVDEDHHCFPKSQQLFILRLCKRKENRHFSHERGDDIRLHTVGYSSSEREKTLSIIVSATKKSFRCQTRNGKRNTSINDHGSMHSRVPSPRFFDSVCLEKQLGHLVRYLHLQAHDFRSDNPQTPIDSQIEHQHFHPKSHTR